MPYTEDKCLGFPIDWGCADPEWVEGLDEDVRERAERLAASTIRMLTAYRVGGCPTVYRPCGLTCSIPLYETWKTGTVGGVVSPYLHDGQWRNGCGCSNGCGCASVQEVGLAPPVGHIVEVWVDGQVVDPQAYRIDDGFRLVRQDGLAWPGCQDMSVPYDAEGAFAVLYTTGVKPDALGAFAAGLLAVEYAKACGASGKCSLPTGVRSVARQGVTWEIEAGAFPDGFTGIREVDLYISMHNPYGAKTSPRIIAIDGQRARTTTWVGHSGS